jgi:hypothetical protein
MIKDAVREAILEGEIENQLLAALKKAVSIAAGLGVKSRNV